MRQLKLCVDVTSASVRVSTGTSSKGSSATFVLIPLGPGNDGITNGSPLSTSGSGPVFRGFFIVDVVSSIAFFNT